MQRQATPHPTQMKTPEVITYRVIKEFSRRPLNENNTANQVVIWVIQWCNQTEPVLEKRRIYIRADGTIRTYKQMPWTMEDFIWIDANRKDICEALRT